MSVDILRKAAIAQGNFNVVVAENGYKAFTTYYGDFTIADAYGEKAIRDTYNRAFNEHKKDIKWLTELSLVLNYKCWNHTTENENGLSVCTEIGEVYRELFYKLKDYIYDEREENGEMVSNFTEEERDYYWRVTD